MIDSKAPPWLPLLNALHRHWREEEILKGNNPDPYLEKHLRETGAWPPTYRATPEQQAVIWPSA